MNIVNENYANYQNNEVVIDFIQSGTKEFLTNFINSFWLSVWINFNLT